MTSTPSGYSGTRHFRGFALLACGQAVARVMTLVATIYVARVLGVEMFGAIGFAAVIVTYFLLLVDAGLDFVAMREIAQRTSSVESIVASVFASRLVLAAVAFVLLWTIGPWLALSPARLAVVLAYGFTLFSFACNLKWGLQALEQNGFVAAALALSQLVYLAGVIVFVDGPDDALKVPLLIFASELVGAGLLMARYRQQSFRLWAPRSRRLSFSLIKMAFPLAGTRAVRAISVNFDLLLLGLVDAPVAVGVYAAVTRIILVLRELGDLYYIPMLPGLSRAAKGASERFAAACQTGLRYAAVIVFPIALGGCLTGPEFLSLVFGPAYASGSTALCLLLLAMVLAMLTGTYRTGLIAHGRQASVFRVMAAGAVLNVAMNLALVPRYSIVGGALSALGSEILILALACTALKTSVPVALWAPIMRPAYAAGGMAAILWLLPPWPFFVAFGIAAVSYVALIFLVGAITPGEAREAWRIVVGKRTEQKRD